MKQVYSHKIALLPDNGKFRYFASGADKNIFLFQGVKVDRYQIKNSEKESEKYFFLNLRYKESIYTQ